MKISAFIFALLFTVTSFAGLETGKYVGTTKNGEVCAIEVVSYSYENNAKHPLNEKVLVIIDEMEWTVKHPPVVSVEEGKVRFDHNFFEAVIPVATGAKFLQMTINHDVEPHAPTSFTLIEDNYRDSSKSSKIVCTGLVQVSK